MSRKFVRRALIVALGIALGSSSSAGAEPAKPAPPGLTLPGGGVSVSATLEVEATAAKAGKPISLAPDVSYGVTPELTLSLVHSTFGVTGFRGGAGRGVCLTGEDRGCAKVYNNVGAEALYGLARGPFALALNAGVHATNLDAGFYAAKAGLRLRWMSGALSLASSPAVLIALTHRDDTPKNVDQLFVPVVVSYRPVKPLTLGLGSGVKGPIDGFGDAWEVSLGFLGGFSLSRQLSLGTSLVFGKALGGAEDPPAPAPAATGQRYRAFQLWLTWNR